MKLCQSVALAATLAASVSVFAAGPNTVTPGRAVVVNDQRIYREATVESKTVGRITVGEEATVHGRQGALLQVTLPGERAGWTLANGIVTLESNPRAAALLVDAAEQVAQQDSADAWRDAARLFRKAATLGGPYAAEAQWRAAELQWRAERATTAAITDATATELKAVVAMYPGTPAAANAAYLLLKQSLCEYWDGTPGCPEAELGAIAAYLEENPKSAHASELRYAIAYRHAALVEIYLQQEKPHFSAEKAVEQKVKARAAVDALLKQDPGTLWAARGERLLAALDANEGVFSGIEVALQK